VLGFEVVPGVSGCGVSAAVL